mgnify:CR=1 FL=1
MRLDIRQLPSTSSLLRDYVHAFPRLAPFFAGNPQAPGAYAEHARQRDLRSYRRRELGDVLQTQNACWGAPAVVHQRIEELGQPRAVAVVTGQQTGLFGGPLFTLYKALTAIGLAARLGQELERPVIPVFWMVSEDHDVAEADHIHLLDRTGALVGVRHTSWGSPDGFMPANLLLGPDVQKTLDRVWELIPSTEFTPPLHEALAHAFAPGRTLAEAFAHWMMHLLGGFGLVLADGADPALKRLATRILDQELQEAPRSSRCILAASDSLRTLGYPVQIEARPDGVNCFLLREGRWGLTKEGEGFRIHDREERISGADLRRLVQDRPERLSPNVALRPIVQDAIFPTIAYIAGPGELAYFAQLRGVYQAFDVPMPLVVPRAFITLLEPRVAQLLERFRLSLPDLTQEPEQLASQVMRALLPADFGVALAKARQSTSAIFHDVAEAISAIDPTLKATVGQAAGHFQGHLDQLERKAVQAMKRRETEARQQIQRVREALMPGGKPQERVFAILPFLAKYGPGLVQTLQAAIDGPGWEHRLIQLGTDRDRDRDRGSRQG